MTKATKVAIKPIAKTASRIKKTVKATKKVK